MTDKHAQASLAGERVKELIDVAVQCGRSFQSPQTGYLHYYEGNQPGDSHHTIPILENVLFALALLRSRTMEHMTEAKELLTKLLVFQCQGNFPIYLHEYPLCRDPLAGVPLLAPYYWILKGFGHVLGQELKQKLEQTIKALIAQGLKWQEEKPMPYSLAVRFAAAVRACHQAFGWTEIGEEKAEQLLDAACHEQKKEHWHSTAYLSDLLIALQMLYPRLDQSPWQAFWMYLCQTWQRQACAYVGPCLKEHQWRTEPEATLYDLFLGYWSGQYAQRTKPCHPYQLQAALIQATEEEFFDLTYPVYVEGSYKNQQWMLYQEQEWAYTLIEKKGELPSAWEKLFTPFRLVWGNAKRTHTLVCQVGSYAQVSYEADASRIKLMFEFNPINLEQEWDKQRELNFYFDAHPDIKVKIGGQPATLFHLEQPVDIQLGSRILSVQFRLEEGNGQFTGHVMRGNRPSQLDTKGEHRFEAYDWHVFIRTIRREGLCRLSATLEIK